MAKNAQKFFNHAKKMFKKCLIFFIVHKKIFAIHKAVFTTSIIKKFIAACFFMYYMQFNGVQNDKNFKTTLIYENFQSYMQRSFIH